jgi:glycosyltransferase involved in cell wall biosynthesis
MKIAIVVHGRFHAFDLARELIGLGHEVLLLTNYPRRWPEKFGVPQKRVKNLLAHGILSRAAMIFGKAVGNEKYGEAFLHRWFGRWSAKVLKSKPFDVIHSFSGVAAEVLQNRQRDAALFSLLRASSHIKTQKIILDEERKRTGIDPFGPSDWMVQRETEEYKLADLIITLSKWCRQTFIEKGFKSENVFTLSPGSNLSMFGPSADTISNRVKRINHEKKIQIITTGSVSLRKGIWDALQVFERAPEAFHFKWIGEIHPNIKKMIQDRNPRCQFHPRIPQFELANEYNQSDVFMTLSLEEGYPAVVAQALASGLPVIATEHAGIDQISEWENGWIVPIRSPSSVLHILLQILNNRQQVSLMVQNTLKNVRVRDFRDTAAEFVALHDERIKKRKKQ